jgi:hypothetical protein
MFAQPSKPVSIPSSQPRLEAEDSLRTPGAFVSAMAPRRTRRLDPTIQRDPFELEPHWAAVIDVATD